MACLFGIHAVQIFLFFLFVNYINGDAADDPGCKECPVGIKCATPTKPCELYKPPCGCCFKCGLKRRQVCSGKTVPCDSKFICVNDQGYGMKNIPYYSDFVGKCIKRARKGIYPVPLKLSKKFVFRGG